MHTNNVDSRLVLRSYSERSRKRYWFILSLPLLYFLIQFQPLFQNLFSPFLDSQPVLFSILYTLVFTLSKPVGGILFSVAFWSIARKLSGNNVVRNYMITSAYGLVIVFVANQAVVLVSAPYPPFGLVTICTLGLSSYLLLVGIYSSAISVAEDDKLRQTIRRTAIKEAKLLDSIGTAQKQDELQRSIIHFNEEEVKEYLDEVMQEIKKSTKH